MLKVRASRSGGCWGRWLLRNPPRPRYALSQNPGGALNRVLASVCDPRAPPTCKENDGIEAVQTSDPSSAYTLTKNIAMDNVQPSQEEILPAKNATLRGITAHVSKFVPCTLDGDCLILRKTAGSDPAAQPDKETMMSRNDRIGRYLAALEIRVVEDCAPRVARWLAEVER